MTQGYTAETLHRAKEHRQTPTSAEAALWKIVRGSRLGVRFRRQQPIGPFIVDFYCSARNLIVEADGAQHGDDPSKDKRRSEWLATKGYDVVRFSNAEVLGDIENVIRTLVYRLAVPLPAASRHPSPSGGEGV